MAEKILKEEYAVKVYEINGEKVVEIINLNNVNKKISLAGKLAKELLETYNGFNKILK